MFSKQRIFLAKAPHAALLHTQKNQSTMAGPQMYEVSSRKGCGKQIHDLLTGGGLLLAPGRFCASSLFLSGLHHDFGTCFYYFLATLRLQEQNNVFWMKCPSFTRFWWLYEWVPTWTCIFVAAPIMTKSVACSQDGATNWTEVLSIITCLCNSMYILIISSMERRCSKQKPQNVSHTSEVHFCLLPLVV